MPAHISLNTLSVMISNYWRLQLIFVLPSLHYDLHDAFTRELPVFATHI